MVLLALVLAAPAARAQRIPEAAVSAAAAAVRDLQKDEHVERWVIGLDSTGGGPATRAVAARLRLPTRPLHETYTCRREFRCSLIDAKLGVLQVPMVTLDGNSAEVVVRLWTQSGGLMVWTDHTVGLRRSWGRWKVTSSRLTFIS